MTTPIEARGLIKTFGRVRALDGLDLSVTEGEVHGFLGPNGAGKSTTIRVLLGLIKSNGGTATVLGKDPWKDAVAIHRDLAYVPGDVSLWPNLSGGEIIDLLTSLRGGADPELRADLIRDFELDPKKRARGYSKGNRQKVALVAAFARPASLYLFDEPTSGLDPVMESVFRAQVERVKADGATVLLSSHILSEVEQLCDRVTIIRAGVAVETGIAQRPAAPHAHQRAGRDPDGRRRIGTMPGRAQREVRGWRARLRRRHGCAATGPRGAHQSRASPRSPSPRRRSRSCSCGTTATASSRRRPPDAAPAAPSGAA